MTTTAGEVKEVVSKDTGVEVRRQSFYSAPLPPASEFEKYEKVLGGSADRIIKLAENQSRHRRFIENIVVISDSLRSLGGLIFGAVIALAGIAGGIYLIMNDKPAEGLGAIIIPLGVVVVAFISNKKSKEGRNRENN